jgi:hypothetical protein
LANLAAEEPDQTGIGYCQGLVPGEPADILALPRPRRGHVGPDDGEEITKVQMGMASSALVHVDVDKGGHTRRARLSPFEL